MDRYRAALAVALALLAAAVGAPASYANVDWFGVNNGQAMRTATVTPTQFYGRLTGMGGNVLREDVGWEAVEPTDDAWQWGYLDNEINAAPPGVGVILMVFNSPRWARDSTADLLTCLGQSPNRCRMPPAENKLGEWKEFVRTIVSRYGERVVAVEVWNEPNLKSFWRPNGNEPARWARLVRATAEAVAEVDAGIPVVAGGLGNGTTSDANVGMMQGPYLDAAYASMPELPAHIDGIGIHPYAGQVAPDAPGNRFAATISEIRAVRDVRDTGKPLWATEVGYHTAGTPAVSEAQQRDWLMQKYDVLLAAPDVRAMVIHALFDPVWVVDLGGTTDPEEGSFGLVRANNDPKPAWSAFNARLGP